ncbi:MAG: thiamine-phosphate kinase [Betaproteobacteria bacterium]|nr:thiamine-phosphate kinase [Betaproteobacteria bacterium]
MSPEFELIARHFTRRAGDLRDGIALGIGDDCALLRSTEGCELAISTDTLVSGVHFFPDVDPARLGRKALAVNLSDLAAMGSAPRWFTLALTLPAIDHAWLAAFSKGLFELADLANIRIVGGDTTRGPLAMTLTVIGEAPIGEALRRDAARAGDEIWVTGSLGDAALGLAILQGRVAVAEPERQAAIDRLELPTPRVELGIALRGLVNAVIDVSDGLCADLGHLCRRSRLGANIRFADVPHPAALKTMTDASMSQQLILAGGDDYELCFTARPDAHANIRNLSKALALPLSCIGVMREGEGVTVLDAMGGVIALPATGFDHFATKPRD